MRALRACFAAEAAREPCGGLGTDSQTAPYSCHLSYCITLFPQLVKTKSTKCRNDAGKRAQFRQRDEAVAKRKCSRKCCTMLGPWLGSHFSSASPGSEKSVAFEFFRVNRPADLRLCDFIMIRIHKSTTKITGWSQSLCSPRHGKSILLMGLLFLPRKRQNTSG